MWNFNASNPSVSLKPPENCREGITDIEKSSVQYNSEPQNCSLIDGPVAILWDIENCCVPSNVSPESVAGNIRMALQTHPVIKGSVVTFSAYGDFNVIPRRVREGCQRTGVKLVDVPNGRKDAADKAILVDMFLFALDNRPPSSIMLITGDVDFAPALHILGQRGYTVILVKPSSSTVSPALCAAGKFVWDWPTVARGEGLVPVGKAFALPRQAQQVGTVSASRPVRDNDLDTDADYKKKIYNFEELKMPTLAPPPPPPAARGEGLAPVSKAFALPRQAQQVGTVSASGPVHDNDLDADIDCKRKLYNFEELEMAPLAPPPPPPPPSLPPPPPLHRVDSVWLSREVSDHVLDPDPDTDYKNKLYNFEELKMPALAPPPPPPRVDSVWLSREVRDHVLDPDPDTDYAKKLQAFRELNTPIFNGIAGSIQAEEWLDQVEQNFEAIQCPAEYKVRIVKCLLLGEAGQWWRSFQSGRPTDLVITWEDFVTALIEKHYPASVRREKLMELVDLQQGSMTVTAYEQCFSKLARFGTNIMATEMLKALRFKLGLRPSIRTKVETFWSSSYSELVSRALIAERNKQTEGSVRCSPNYHQNTHVVSHDFIPIEEQKPPKKATVSAKRNRRRCCSECGNYHKGACRQNSKACYRCGNSDHLLKDCPHGKQPGAAIVSSALPAFQTVTGLQIKPVVHHYLSTEECALSMTVSKKARR